MQKMNFEEAQMTVVSFQAEDIITTSYVSGEGSGTNGGFGGDLDMFG